MQVETTPIQLSHSNGGLKLFVFARVFATGLGMTRKQQDETKYNKYYKNSNNVNLKRW